MRPMSAALMPPVGVDGGERLAAVLGLVEPVLLACHRPAPALDRDHVLAVGAGDDRHRGDVVVVRVVGRGVRIVGSVGRQHLGPLTGVGRVAVQAVVGGRVGVALRIEGQLIDGLARDRVAAVGVPDASDPPVAVAVHPDAGVAVLVGVGLTGAGPDRAVGGVDRERADRGARQLIGERVPVRALITGAPDTTVGGAGQPDVAGRGQRGHAPADVGKARSLVAPEGIGVVRRIAVVGLVGDLLPGPAELAQPVGLLLALDKRLSGDDRAGREALEVVRILLIGEVAVVRRVVRRRVTRLNRLRGSTPAGPPRPSDAATSRVRARCALNRNGARGASSGRRRSRRCTAPRAPSHRKCEGRSRPCARLRFDVVI